MEKARQVLRSKDRMARAALMRGIILCVALAERLIIEIKPKESVPISPVAPNMRTRRGLFMCVPHLSQIFSEA